MSLSRYPAIIGQIGAVLLIGALVSCQSIPNEETTFHELAVTIELDLDYGLYGEVVFAKLHGDNAADASVTVGGVPAEVTVLSGNTFEFPVPPGAPTGRQPVVIDLVDRTLVDEIFVLGNDVVEREFMLVLAPGTTEGELAGALEGIDYQLLEGPYSLGLDGGICGGDRVHLSISGMGTGKALTELASRTDGGTILNSDPTTGYSSGTIDHLGAVGATEAHLRGVDGAGTMIAVIDTGVSSHSELGTRLLMDQGYDFVDLGTSPVDDYPGGHGTPIAVLAAGSASGVAPAAQILPIRVCDENGLCYSDDILAGICHALATAKRNGVGIDDLVLNLSFGGETPVPAIEQALRLTLDNGGLVAASAGNGGESGSPPHYPAAFNIAGTVVSAGLQASTSDELLSEWEPAPFSTRGSYVDIAAPATDLRSGSPDGFYQDGYFGTSYANALTAGALALWREVHPGMSPTEVEASLKAAAKPLPYSQEAVGAGMLDLSSEPH